MRFYIIFLILILSTTGIVYTQTETPNLNTLIQYLEVESLDKSFTSIAHADEFIEKFELNEEELKLVGNWFLNDFIEENKRVKNTYFTVKFLPNRILELHIPNRLNNRISIFCFWRVSKNSVEIRPLYLLEIKEEKGVVEIANGIMINNSDYFSIGEIEKYEQAYVQRFPWNWEKLNEYIDREKITFGIDNLRYRWVFEYAMPNVFQNIGIREDVRDLLYNPEYDDSEYFFKLYLKS